MTEEFEKWADEERLHGLERAAACDAWLTRQPEIDAWAADSVRLSGIIDNWKERCDMQGMEIAALKAENTRMRLVAEKYVAKELGDALDELEEEPREKEVQVYHSVDQVNLWADLYDELGDYDQIVEMLRGYSHLLSVYESLKTAPQPEASQEGK